MGFHVIQPTPGLDRARRRRANSSGPPGVALPTSYQSLLRTAGFVDVVTTDVTAEYRATQARWIVATESREPAMRAAMGDDEYDERVIRRHEHLAAIDAGLLSRFRYLATR